MTDSKKKTEYDVVLVGEGDLWHEAVARHLQERQPGEVLVVQAPSLPNREPEPKLDLESLKLDLIEPLPAVKPKYSDRLEKRLRKRK